MEGTNTQQETQRYHVGPSGLEVEDLSAGRPRGRRHRQQSPSLSAEKKNAVGSEYPKTNNPTTHSGRKHEELENKALNGRRQAKKTGRGMSADKENTLCYEGKERRQSNKYTYHQGQRRTAEDN